MLDPSLYHSGSLGRAPGSPAGGPQYYTTGHERMAGTVPVWGRPPAGQAPAAINTTAPPTSSGHALTSNETMDKSRNEAAASEPFGFFDLLDMFNPLHHVPVVGSVYRKVTGDEIKPIARIIGGTVFGGPVGGAGGLANVIVEHETGRDVAGNVVAFVRNGEAPQWRSHPHDPVRRLDEAVRLAESPAAAHKDDLPPQALAFADTHAAPAKKYYHHDDNDRMAGSVPRYGARPSPPVTTPPRDPIMTLDMTPLPLLQDERFKQN